jgi:hypothetical protein
MRKSQTDRGASYQPEDVPGDRCDSLERRQRGDQADGHVESHRPALFAQMLRLHVVGTDRGRDGELRGVFGHTPILARRERLSSAAIRSYSASKAAGRA